jgi:hypothetical protein
MRHALVAGAGLAAVGAIGTAWLLRAHRPVRSTAGASDAGKLALEQV